MTSVPPLPYLTLVLLNSTPELRSWRQAVEDAVLNRVTPEEGSAKPICITLWSGRGSGKTSLMRHIALNSSERDRQRESGGLMVSDGKIFEIVKSELTLERMSRVVPVMVALHLCRVFGDSSVMGVNFASNASFEALWRENPAMPSSLLIKLRSILTGEQAYTWWRDCTKSLTVNDNDPRPIILLDTAETLCVFRDEQPDAPVFPNAEAKKSAQGGTDAGATKHPYQHNNRYSALEWLMMSIPVHHTMICFGTGATRDYPQPANYLTHVNHYRIEPLTALSEESARKLYVKHKNVEQQRVPICFHSYCRSSANAGHCFLHKDNAGEHKNREMGGSRC